MKSLTRTEHKDIISGIQYVIVCKGIKAGFSLHLRDLMMIRPSDQRDRGDWQGSVEWSPDSYDCYFYWKSEPSWVGIISWNHGLKTVSGKSNFWRSRFWSIGSGSSETRITKRAGSLGIRINSEYFLRIWQVLMEKDWLYSTNMI